MSYYGNVFLNLLSRIRFAFAFAWLLMLSSLAVNAQQPVTSVVLADTNYSVLSMSNIKGAGLRNGSNNLFSYWDSTGYNAYTINYSSSSSADSRKLVQANVSGLSSALYPVSIPDAVCKIRRKANATVTSNRDHFNLWMRATSTPAVNDTSGTFAINSPYLSTAEECFLSGNLNNGIDNAFCNDINYAHEGNIERIDLISPSGFSVFNSTAIDEAGFIVLDRGVGDNFAIAAISAIDSLNNPTAYKPLLKVSAADFGSNNIISSSLYVIFNHDSMYGGGRPSTSNSQGQRGVFISLSDLGLDSVGKKFYGISIFGDDITTAYDLVDFTTFPNTTSTGGGLDITAHFGLFKTGFSALPITVLHFHGQRMSAHNAIEFQVSDYLNCKAIVLEYSANEDDFQQLTRFSYHVNQTYKYNHAINNNGNASYRLRLEYADGRIDYSQILLIENTDLPIQVFPNPFSNAFTIHLPEGMQAKNYKVELLSANGKSILLKGIALNENSFFIQTEDLPKGFYLVNVRNISTGVVYSKKLFVE